MKLLLLLAVLAAPAQAVPDTIAERTKACMACHGKAGDDVYFPRIAGKPGSYLYQQLINFRDGRRSYPAMNYLVAHLSDDYLREMADYFASLEPRLPALAPAAPASVMEQGRKLVFDGDKSRKLPACVACHGQRLTGMLPAIPGLLGLPPAYLKAQIGAWRSGTRKAAAPDCMLHVSQQLTPQEIGAVASWLAHQPVPTDKAPSPALASACRSAQP
ncbi:MAG: c-type cytochrome [Pseudomonadota bacterium]